MKGCCAAVTPAAVTCPVDGSTPPNLCASVIKG